MFPGESMMFTFLEYIAGSTFERHHVVWTYKLNVLDGQNMREQIPSDRGLNIPFILSRNPNEC